jgi:hypothetical protein
LEQHVGGSKFRNQQIGIQVYRLLDNLRANEQAPGRAMPPLFPKFLHPILLPLLATEERKA